MAPKSCALITVWLQVRVLPGRQEDQYSYPVLVACSGTTAPETAPDTSLFVRAQLVRASVKLAR